MAHTTHHHTKTAAEDYRNKKEREGYKTSMKKIKGGWSVSCWRK